MIHSFTKIRCPLPDSVVQMLCPDKNELHSARDRVFILCYNIGEYGKSVHQKSLCFAERKTADGKCSDVVHSM